MGDRITLENLHQRCKNLNRRLEGTGRGVTVESHSGSVSLYETFLDPAREGTAFEWQVRDTITVGTKAEIGQFLRAMMLGIDLLRRRT